MNDDPLSRELRRLPRPGASPGFTERVLRRLEGAPAAPRRAAWRRRLAPAAAAAGLAVAVAAGAWLLRAQERSEARARAAALRERHHALAREIEDLRALQRDTAPVLYLGGDERVDFVLDLASLVETRSAPEPPEGARGSRPTARDPRDET